MRPRISTFRLFYLRPNAIPQNNMIALSSVRLFVRASASGARTSDYIYADCDFYRVQIAHHELPSIREKPEWKNAPPETNRATFNQRLRKKYQQKIRSTRKSRNCRSQISRYNSSPWPASKDKKILCFSNVRRHWRDVCSEITTARILVRLLRHVRVTLELSHRRTFFLGATMPTFFTRLHNALNPRWFPRTFQTFRDFSWSDRRLSRSTDSNVSGNVELFYWFQCLWKRWVILLISTFLKTSTCSTDSKVSGNVDSFHLELDFFAKTRLQML